MIRGDQVAIYKKDMYKAKREGMTEVTQKVPEVFRMITGCTGAGDKETQLLGAGRMNRHTAEGQDILFKSPVQGWETLVKFHTYSAGLALTKEAVVDTTKGGNLLKELARTWGKYGTIAKEEMGARVFNKGGDLLGEWVFNGTHTGNTDASGDMMYDSEPLFNLTGNTRSTKGGGTYYTSVAGLTMTAGNFETLYNLQVATNNRDEEDEIVGNPANTILCLPGSDKFLAERIVDTTRGMPGGNLNDKNPYYGIIDKIIAWDYLSTTEDAFFVGQRNHEKFCFCDRQGQETDFYEHKPNKGYRASIDMRFGVWLKAGSWRAWVRGGGTSA